MSGKRIRCPECSGLLSVPEIRPDSGRTSPPSRGKQRSAAGTAKPPARPTHSKSSRARNEKHSKKTFLIVGGVAAALLLGIGYLIGSFMWSGDKAKSSEPPAWVQERMAEHDRRFQELLAKNQPHRATREQEVRGHLVDANVKDSERKGSSSDPQHSSPQITGSIQLTASQIDLLNGMSENCQGYDTPRETVEQFCMKIGNGEGLAAGRQLIQGNAWLPSYDGIWELANDVQNRIAFSAFRYSSEKTNGLLTAVLLSNPQGRNGKTRGAVIYMMKINGKYFLSDEVDDPPTDRLFPSMLLRLSRSFRPT